MCLPLGERGFLIASHEATVPGNIGCKNGREPTRYAFAGQGTSPASVEGHFMLCVIVAWATMIRMRIADEVASGRQHARYHTLGMAVRVRNGSEGNFRGS